MKKDIDIISYALLKDLEKYRPQIGTVHLPDFISPQNHFDALIAEASHILLQGSKASFDPQKPVGLQPIIEHLHLAPQEGQVPYTHSLSEQVFPFVPMDTSDASIFPRSDSSGDLKALWGKFDKEYQHLLNHISGQHVETFTETLTFLLKKYTSCIPLGEENGHRGISLFEYLRLRASLAHCLSVVKQEEAINGFPLLLFCADISGIQNFIYNIVRKKALKALKGRSFYLQLLMDGILQQMIDDPDIGATMAHVVFNSGGKMYLLLPHTQRVINGLNELEKTLARWMWTEHKERLLINQAYIPFRYTEAYQLWAEVGGKEERLSAVGGLWEALKKKTSDKKFQAFRHIFSSEAADQSGKQLGYEGLFEPINEGLDASAPDPKGAICEITGDYLDLTNRNERDFHLNSESTDETPILVNPSAKTHTRIGYIMKNAIHYNTKLGGGNHGQNISFIPTGSIEKQLKREYDVNKEYWAKPKSFKELQLFLPSFAHNRIRYINDTQFLNLEDATSEHKEKSSYGFYFYGGNTPALAPESEQEKVTKFGKRKEKETHQLAGRTDESEKHKGFHRLGVLRMDVDNLGLIFKDGFGAQAEAEGIPSLLAYSTLSAQLDWFFGGYLSWLRDEGPNFTSDPNHAYKDWINILYSGGDDLFLFGRWDLVIEIAERIQNDFQKFVAFRKDISISGGLSLIGPKFPLSKGAEWAGVAEKASKSIPGKNAFTFFNETVKWGYEFDFVKRKKDDILSYMEQRKISRQFVYKLYSLLQVKKKGLNDWRWMIVYTFGQYADKSRDRDVKDFFHRMKNDIFFDRDTSPKDSNQENHNESSTTEAEKVEGRLFELYVMAFQWAELLDRQRTGL